ncbi:hypothetical protein SprV_0401673200 [Sparganum proliferum]
MKPTDTSLARFYGLLKIHKPNVSLRPIVALKGSLTYNLSKWMARKLNFLREGSRTSINSAFQFLADIRGKVVRPDQIMMSLERCLTLSVHPRRLGAQRATQTPQEKYDETTGPLKIQHLMLLFPFCQRTFFTFNGRTYEQIKGTPMGSPISSLVAEPVLQELENVAFHYYEPAFWRPYVDDTFVIIERSRLTDLQDLLNGIFPDIQFIREEEHAEQLPFLDVLVTRTPNGELNTTVYRKATNRTQILNYHSNHPMAHKRSCVRALFQRVHKYGAPLRPIVSFKGTPTYGLAKWLFRRLKFLTADSDTTVSSSAQFLEKLKGDLAIETIELLVQSKYNESSWTRPSPSAPEVLYQDVLHIRRHNLRTGEGHTNAFADFGIHHLGGPATVRVAGLPTPQTEVLDPNGFGGGRSCLTNLTFTLERWTNAPDEGNVVHAIYIDFKKAFDSVPHQSLLHKVRNAGIRGRLLVWIQSFLPGRSQIVHVGRQQSSEVSMIYYRQNEQVTVFFNTFLFTGKANFVVPHSTEPRYVYIYEGLSSSK